jgi:hypothetical protein
MPKLVPLLALALAACSSEPTRLSLTARTGGATARLAAPAAGAALSAGPGVNLTRVRLVIDRIRLDPSSDAGVPSPDGGVAGEQLVTGPFLVDLSGAALESGLTQVFEVDAAPGDYRRFRFRVHKLDGGDRQFPDMAGLSMRVEGTFQGAPFTFTSAVDEEQEREGLFTVSPDAANNLTLAIDPSGWFSDGGAAVSPIAAQADGSLRSGVEGRIKDSIDAFDDDDRDGRR